MACYHNGKSNGKGSGDWGYIGPMVTQFSMKGVYRAKKSDLRIDSLIIQGHGRICPSTKGLQVVGKRPKC